MGSRQSSSEGSVAKTSSSVVVVGSLERLTGNRHQLKLTTSDTMVDSHGTLRSYYCPAGASITPTWVSARCTHRATYTLSNFSQSNETRPIGKISITGKSATQKAPINATKVGSTLPVTIGVTISLYGQPGHAAQVTGTVHSRGLQATPRYGGYGYPR
ncbi:MAG TPA: hypothetical protein H9805_11660 [Candidatus Janibacter merdipullorum]|nr:hypothetical protein [Candidatus Janibacter merdipullorum]